MARILTPRQKLAIFWTEEEDFDFIGFRCMADSIPDITTDIITEISIELLIIFQLNYCEYSNSELSTIEF